MIDPIPIFKNTYKDKDGKPLVKDEPFGDCPFCGEVDNGNGTLAIMETNPSGLMGNERWFIECHSCGGRGPDTSSLITAVDMWNEVGELIEELLRWRSKAMRLGKMGCGHNLVELEVIGKNGSECKKCVEDMTGNVSE